MLGALGSRADWPTALGSTLVGPVGSFASSLLALLVRLFLSSQSAEVAHPDGRKSRWESVLEVMPMEFNDLLVNSLLGFVLDVGASGVGGTLSARLHNGLVCGANDYSPLPFV